MTVENCPSCDHPLTLHFVNKAALRRAIGESPDGIPKSYCVIQGCDCVKQL